MLEEDCSAWNHLKGEEGDAQSKDRRTPSELICVLLVRARKTWKTGTNGRR